MTTALTNPGDENRFKNVPEVLRPVINTLAPKLQMVAVTVPKEFFEGLEPDEVVEALSVLAEARGVDQQAKYLPEVIRIDHKEQEFVFETKQRFETIDVVIVFFHHANGLWVEGDPKKLPVCSSLDANTGRAREDAAAVWAAKYGTLPNFVPITWAGQERSCLDCPMLAFGTDPKGAKAKACKEKRRMFVMYEGAILPAMLAVAGTSFKALDEFTSMLLRRGMATAMARVTLGLQEAEGQGQEFSKVIVKGWRPLPTKEFLDMQRIAKSIKDQAVKIGIDYGDDRAEGGSEDHAPRTTAYDDTGLGGTAAPVNPNQGGYAPGEAQVVDADGVINPPPPMGAPAVDADGVIDATPKPGATGPDDPAARPTVPPWETPDGKPPF